VITVVKADSYGHGAVATALFLADTCGADAFAVATLEEGIALRKAFEQNPPGRWTKKIASLFHNATACTTDIAAAVGQTFLGANGAAGRQEKEAVAAKARSMRPSQIRIIVLGPPVGYPGCFNDYYHYNIEAMISGPEVAASLAAWVANEAERKRTQVERAAAEAKEQALQQQVTFSALTKEPESFNEQVGDNTNGKHVSDHSSPADSSPATGTQRKVLPHPSSTLGNVQGRDLANEVRAMLMKQKAATEAAESIQMAPVAPPTQRGPLTAGEVHSAESSVGETWEVLDPSTEAPSKAQNAPVPSAGQKFHGIEAVAKTSRHRAAAAAKVQGQDVANEVQAMPTKQTDATEESEVFRENSAEYVEPEERAVETASTVSNASSGPAPTGPARKRLRWHALVDSGMGRLGFKTEPVKGDANGRKDTVEILKELVDAEILSNAPIEFYGMCTHMADARMDSDFTHSQIERFVGLLKRVRKMGISVPTVSTDNSAALLTPSLTHFRPEEILSQPDAYTRGFVRIGGAIYGQRPAFKQLKAPSTLIASVRHVAVLEQGESVGYDRAYVAPYAVRIATLTIGFADGYPRELGNGVGKVAIRGFIFPVAGNVCMDMLMVELGPAEETTGVGATVVVGDTAVLWGPVSDDDCNDGEGLVRLQDIASTLKTTQSALTCGLDKIRVPRYYV
jgi:alanine racemase